MTNGSESRAIPLGILTALFNFIPNIGSIMAGVPAILIAFSQSLPQALFVAVKMIYVEDVLDRRVEVKGEKEAKEETRANQTRLESLFDFTRKPFETYNLFGEETFLWKIRRARRSSR